MNGRTPRPAGRLAAFIVMSRWRPRRLWLAEHCPKLHAIVLRVGRLPALAPVIERNFPSQSWRK
ncbi:MAG TPA: hypothetical protein VF688_13250 [Allosphingosinicella sp.]|jgi:hypothetical protein